MVIRYNKLNSLSPGKKCYKGTASKPMALVAFPAAKGKAKERRGGKNLFPCSDSLRLL